MGSLPAYLDCTTLEALKDQMKGIKSNDSQYDDGLSQLITATSVAIQNWIGTPLALGQRTEEYDVVARQPFLFLRAWPVTSVTAVRVSSTWEFSSVTPMTSTNYRVTSSTGVLYFLDELLEPDTTGLYPSRLPLAAQVIYTAGFGATTADIIANYSPLQTACHLWVAAIWKQREAPLAISERISETSVARGSELRMPKAVEEMLWPYRRITFGPAN